MLDFFIWLLIIVFLGWISFPLGFLVFNKIPGKGYALAKPLGLLIWSFFFWILVSLGLLRNDLSGQLVAAALLLTINLFAAKQIGFSNLKHWIRANLTHIITVELIFILCFAFWAFIRSANPAIAGTEKPMEMAFITSILRSPSFPPQDPWLSGYAISYYYFGYVMVAMLTRISATPVGIAYNLSAALWFALTAVSAYGVMFEIIKLRWLRKIQKQDQTTPSWIHSSSLLAPLMMLLVSNWHGFLDILHARGLFWKSTGVASYASRFWQWINLKELTNRPITDLSWFPQRIGGIQWWAASRVLQDFKLTGEAIEIIDEFPFFSYLLSDLHPHLLAMPFVLLLILQALNLFVFPAESGAKLRGRQLPFTWAQYALGIVSLGGLAFLNTWDFPFYLALISAAIVLASVVKNGWKISNIYQLGLNLIVWGLPAILLYLPFFIGFGSQAGGILPSLIFFTRGIYFWIMFGPLLIPLFVFLIFKTIKNKNWRELKTAFLLTLCVLVLLFLLSWAGSFVITKLPELNTHFLWLQGAEQTGVLNLLIQAILNRLKDPGTWISLGLLMMLCLALILKGTKNLSKALAPQEGVTQKIAFSPMTLFVCLLILWGILLALAPEFVYLRDQFNVRMNTIFKFYFQTWILWSIAAAYGVLVFWRKSRRWNRIVKFALGLSAIFAIGVFLFSILEKSLSNNQNLSFSFYILENKYSVADGFMLLLALVLFGLMIAFLIQKKWLWSVRLVIILSISLGLIYPIIALWNKTDGLNPYGGLTLDGTDYYRQIWPDQMEAVDWLSKAPLGVLAEAISPTGGSYTSYASVSTFSGMPTVLGWIGHELQWRGGGDEIGNRQEDIKVLYSTGSWQEALRVIQTYDIDYIYVGELERNTYVLNENKFIENLDIVFQKGTATIYAVSNANGYP